MPKSLKISPAQNACTLYPFFGFFDHLFVDSARPDVFVRRARAIYVFNGVSGLPKWDDV